MLYRLEIENFSSFRDKQILDFTVGPAVADDEGRFAPIYEGAELRAPKVIAIYGANASGKTTVLKALQFLIQLVRDSAQRTVPGFPCDRFNDLESCSRPIRLAIEFGGLMNLSAVVIQRSDAGEQMESGVYRYEVSIEVRDGNAVRIESEALRQRPNAQGKWQRVFERDSDGKIKDSPSFSMSGYRHLEKTLPPHVSALASFALFQHPAAILYVEAAKRVVLMVDPNMHPVEQPVLNFLNTQPEMLSRLNREISRIDVGVEAMRFVDTPNGPQAFFKHSGLQVEMPLILESHGTRSFIRMYPGLALTLDQGGVALIDEMDASIHPLILPELVRWFHDGENRNKLDAQLWFSCHSVSLLDELTKEEIVICEKDRHGRSHVHSLMDVKVRRDENHYRKYLSGAYGGIPQIG